MPLVIGTSLVTCARSHSHMCCRLRLTKIHCARWLRVQGVVAGRWATGRPAAEGGADAPEEETDDDTDDDAGTGEPGDRPAGPAGSAPSLSAEQPESSTAATATRAAPVRLRAPMLTT